MRHACQPFVFNLFVSLFSSFSFLIDSIHFIPCFCLFCFLDWTVIRDVSFAWIATWLLGCNLGNLRLQPLTFPQPPSPAKRHSSCANATQHNTTQHGKRSLVSLFFPKAQRAFFSPEFSIKLFHSKY
jgi:hypothetical protein